MPGVKTNERPGTRAVLRYSHLSAFKAREVLDLIRGVDYVRAAEILESSERGAAKVVGKLLDSAAANARHNDQLEPEELFVSACYADEGTTMKRWRPRARGRATRIRKRTCHITVILSRMPDDEIARRRARVAAEQAERRARRVAGTRRARRQAADLEAEVAAEEAAEIAAAEAAAEAEAAQAAAAEAADTGAAETDGGEPEAEAAAPADKAGEAEPADQEDEAVQAEPGVAAAETAETDPGEARADFSGAAEGDEQESE
jgi:large subunit ribosomal protein L22